MQIKAASEVRKPTEFEKIALDVACLLAKKNSDYGCSYDLLRGEYGPESFLIRLADKYHRLKKLVRSMGRPEVDESIEDTLKDIIGYCILEIRYRIRERASDEDR